MYSHSKMSARVTVAEQRTSEKPMTAKIVFIMLFRVNECLDIVNKVKKETGCANHEEAIREILEVQKKPSNSTPSPQMRCSKAMQLDGVSVANV